MVANNRAREIPLRWESRITRPLRENRPQAHQNPEDWESHSTSQDMGLRFFGMVNTCSPVAVSAMRWAKIPIPIARTQGNAAASPMPKNTDAKYAPTPACCQGTADGR